MNNPGPGFKKYPQHRISVKAAGVRVKVTSNGELIADTRDAVALQEGKSPSVVAPVVYYIPRKDVKMERLERTSHKTHCPFKGDAAYFSVKAGAENSVWSYETPFDEMLSIKEHLAFYPDKFSISVEGAAP